MAEIEKDFVHFHPIGSALDRAFKDSYQLLLCSHSPNDVPPEPQWNVSIAAVRGAVRPSKIPMKTSPCDFIEILII